MALDKSAIADLLDALRAGGDLDIIREGLAVVLQALIDAEATEVIGADRYQRTASRTTHRNGSRARLLSTKAGDVELRIPKLREGSFFPALLEPRRRIDRALLAVVMEAYVHGTSTRKVDDLVKALGVEAGISKSEVSRICAELDPEVAAFRSRVPTAELPRPRIRSPSQCPGTVRSSASAGPLADHDLRGDELACPGLLRAPWHPQRPPGAQTGDQLAAQRAAALHVQCLIDRLVRDPHRLIIREVDAAAGSRSAPGSTTSPTADPVRRP